MRQKQIGLLVLLILIIGFLYFSYQVDDRTYGMMSHHYGYYDNFSSYQFLFNTGVRILVFLLLIFCVIKLLDFSKSGDTGYIRILNQRLSNGEISIEEYKKIKNEIEK